jgi:hypothetical protein
MVAACCNESGEGSGDAWENIVPLTQKTATTNRRIVKERRTKIWIRIRDKTRLRNELVCSFYSALRTNTQAVT